MGRDSTARGDAAPRPWSAWVPLAAVLCGTALLRARLLSVPLERDEGEYAYMGQLILQGEVPYVAAHSMKLPGTYYAYAAILRLFGETDIGIRLGLLAINLASIVLVHRLARRLLDPLAAVAAAAAFALLSLSAGVLGVTANAEHFVVLPMLGGVLLLVGLDETPARARIVAAGLLLGLAYVMKQHGIAFVAFGGLWTLVAARRRGVGAGEMVVDGVAFAAAALIPFLVVCLAMVQAGAFRPFWFWTITYAREYATLHSFAMGAARFVDQTTIVLGASTALWALAGLGATAIAWDAETRRRAVFLGLLGVTSFVAVCPGLRFTDHYFVLTLPIASLLAGAAASALARATGVRAMGVAAAAVAVALSLVQERDMLFRLTPIEVSRRLFGVNPFPEAVAIGRWLQEHTAPEERIAVVGSEPEIYFYARRRAATTFIYTYPLMEPHPYALRMQEDMIAQLEQARPRYLVLVGVDTSWTRRPESSTRLFEWTQRTVDAAYRRVGIVEIPPGEIGVPRWGDEAATVPLRAGPRVLTYERRADAPSGD